MDSKSIKKLVKLMREQGVLSLKSQEIELSLSPAAIFPKGAKQEAESDAKPVGQYTEEDALFWSTGLVPPDQKATQ